jgi:trehalose 6-phosphate synthase
MIWDKHSLQELVRNRLSDYLFVIVSNREPYVHSYQEEQIKCTIPASGLTIALDPIMRACGGTWIAHGHGSADRDVVDKNNKVAVPPENPRYNLRRLWLTKEEENGYYLGFSNQALWPLCHIVYTRPVFAEENWKTYHKVNRMFADAVLEEIGGRKALVFIQDYHLALLSKMVKEKSPDTITAQFWHIPWPNREAFRICPWQEEILEGLLHNNLLGFHITYHCNNFIETVDRTLESKIDHEKSAIIRSGRTTLVRPFPISIDYDQLSRDAKAPEVLSEMESLRHKWGLHDCLVGVGLDRIDYTKGIPERLLALDILFSRHPEYLGKIVFFQLGEASRVQIQEYLQLNSELYELIEKINWKHATDTWKPIIIIKEHLPPLTLLAFRRLADFFIVSSLHDGMNLVAKEYIASRVDGDGVLILSRFTGAARELDEALLVNPFAPEQIAEAIIKAIEMPGKERRQRMHRLQNVVKNNNIYKWASDIVETLTSIA